MAESGKDVRPDKQSLEMADLISVPIAALMRAQSLGQAESLAQMIETGFVREGGVLKPLNLEFQFNHPQPDPTRPGEFVNVPAAVSAPVIALMRPVPLTIDSAELEFRFAITGVDQPPARPTNVKADDPRALKNVGTQLERRDLPKFRAAFTSPQPAQGSINPIVTVKVSLKARSPAEGQARLEQILADAISAGARPTKPTGDAR